MNEPAIDLGIALAIVSSMKDQVISDRVICFGEIGLSGEVRSVQMAEQRVNEAKKLGFERVILPASNLKALKNTKGIDLVGVSNIAEAVKALD